MSSDAPVEGECSDRTMFLILYGFYMAWMMGIAVIAYNKLHGSNDYATHFVGRKDYGIFVMMLTIFASTVSGNSVSNNPNTASGLGYMAFWIITVYSCAINGFGLIYPRVRRISVERKYNSFSDILSDRVNSKPLLYMVLVFPLCSMQAYCVAQLWAYRELIPVVSAGYIAKNPITIITTIIVYVCESLGGFDAVSFTDVVQGIIIIFALAIGPIYMTTKFGSLEGTTEFNCPATYFDTIPDPNSNGTIQRRRGCYAYISPWNVIHPAAKEFSYFFKPIWPTYGIDGSFWFNHTACIAYANYWIIFCFCIFPHVIQRVYASKSDTTCKQSMIGMNMCMILAGMPGILLGFFYAINLKPVYPAGAPAFGAILDFMMRQGGFAEFAGVAAACGALAAIMSTVDSCVLACTNIVTKEIIINGLAHSYPQLVEPRMMTIQERGMSGLVLGIALFFVAYYIPIIVEDNPLEATLMMNRIGFYQFGFITQSFPSVIHVLFHPFNSSPRPLPMIIGTLQSWIVLPIVTVTLWEAKAADGKTMRYGVPPEIPDSVPYLYMHPATYTLFISFWLQIGLNKVMPDGVAMLTSQPADLLTDARITEIMEGTQEIIFNKAGQASTIGLFVLQFFSLPWYGSAYDGCNYETYGEYNDWVLDNSNPKPPDCEPGPIAGFAPVWGTVMFAATVFCFGMNAVQFLTWKPKADDGSHFEEGQEGAIKKSG